MGNPDAGATFQEIKRSLSEFATVETELAKAELVPAAKKAGIGSGLFAGASAFFFHALWMLIITAALAISWLLKSVTPLGILGAFTIGFLTTAVLSVLIGFVLVKVGQQQFKQVKAPEATIAEAKATMNAITDAMVGASSQLEPVAGEPGLPN